MIRGEQDIEVYKNGSWRRALYRAGTLGMTPAGETDRLRRRQRTATTPVEKASLYVPNDFFLEAIEHYRSAGQRAGDVRLAALAFDDPLVAHAVLALLRAMVAGAPDLYAEVTMQWLATHLLSAHCGWRADEGSGKRYDVVADPRLARVIEFMTAHFDEAVTLDRALIYVCDLTCWTSEAITVSGWTGRDQLAPTIPNIGRKLIIEQLLPTNFGHAITASA